MALILGIILAYPLLVMNLPAERKEIIGVDVVYAYLGTPYLNANISGLWRDYSMPKVVNVGGTRYGLDVNVVSYFIVLNVTNRSNQLEYITNIGIIAGPSIKREPNGGISASNPIVTDSRNVELYPGFGNLWSANTSRLIYISGIVGVHDLVYNSLNGSIWIHAQVDGRSYEGNIALYGVDYKQIPLQTFGNARLYNNLVGEDQTLIFYNGLDVSVGSEIAP